MEVSQYAGDEFENRTTGTSVLENLLLFMLPILLIIVELFMVQRFLTICDGMLLLNVLILTAAVSYVTGVYVRKNLGA